jgi:hypothetical protein
LADRALHFVPADLIVRWLGDQPPVSETATVIPARGATGLSTARLMSATRTTTR